MNTLSVAAPRPPWIRARAPLGPGFERVREVVRSLDLHTVCEAAHCPNQGECWNHGTATFLILGEVCTRACGFCAVKTGRAGRPPDPQEPSRLTEAVSRLGLSHVVITSVSRDDLGDGGAGAFVACIRALRDRVASCSIEVLVPDFNGDWQALALVTDARPDVLGHNLETVPRLYPRVRPGASFERSIELLERAKYAGSTVKCGVMVGLGEASEEVIETMHRIHQAGADILTVGQYLRPTGGRLPVVRYYSPDEFRRFREIGFGMGFAGVESGPLVRSSYRAGANEP